jgi:Listeria/Bacterioides repeat
MQRISPPFYKFYNPADAKLHYGPIWDFDVGFGNDGEGQVAAVTGWYIKNGFWTTRMFEDSLFVHNVIERWNEQKEALDASVQGMFLSLASEDSVSAETNFMKWDVLGKDIYHNSAGFEERLTYQSEVDYMKDWVEERIAWIDNALKNSFFISYDLDGGTLPTANPNVFLSEDTEPFQLNNPVKEGYVFAGWSGTGIDGTSETVQVTDDKSGNKAFKANWKADIAFYEASFAESEFVYSGAALTPAVVVAIEGGEPLTAETDYVVSYANNVEAGVATVTITGVGDFGGILEKTFTIAPKPVTLTVSDTSKMYGETDPEFGFTVEGLVERDGAVEELKDVELARAEGEDLGEYAINAVVNVETNPNYAVTVEPGTFTIVPNNTEILVTITGHSDSVVYDGEEHTV